MLSTLHACYLAATWRATLVWECRMGHLYPPFFLLFFLLSGTVRTVTYDEHLCTLAGSRGFFMVLHL